MTLQLLALFAVVGLAVSAPGYQRPERSLEEYLPPHHPQHTAQSSLKDYLPPKLPVVDSKINADAEPCDCDGESKGYFYPKPDQIFEAAISRTLDQEIPTEEEPVIATTAEPAETTAASERPARSPKKSNLVTSPTGGPVRISTLPFFVSKTDSHGRALKFRRDTSDRSKLSKVDGVVVRPAEKKAKTGEKTKGKV